MALILIQKNEYGEIALHLAMNYYDENVVKILLDAGADPNVVNAIGQSPLHMAANDGCPDTVKILINAGAFYDAIDYEHNWTPLHYAAFKKFYRCNKSSHRRWR